MSQFRKTLCLLLICVLFGAVGANAQYWGADIGWEKIGEDSFLIKVSAYHNCSSGLQSPADLDIKDLGGAYSTTAALSGGTTLDITPLCSGKTGPCSSSSNPDVAFGNSVVTYSALAVLPSTTCEYSITWNECCLSSEITTGPAEADLLVEALINRCGKAPSSFSFGAPPQMLLCRDKCQTIAHPLRNDESADAADDSVVYSMPALFSYNTGYSATEPVKYNGKKGDTYSPPQCAGFHLDPATGTLNFKPTQSDVSPYVIQADLYRLNSSGQRYLAGSIMRTYTMFVTSDYGCSTNKAPVIAGTGDQYMLTGKEYEFKVTVSDPDAQDVSLQALNSLPGASIISDGAKPNPTLTIKWKPTQKQARTAPYILQLSATDNNCPVPGITQNAIRVFVLKEPLLRIHCSKPQQCLSTNFFELKAEVQPEGSFTYTWETSDGRSEQTIQPQMAFGFLTAGVHSVRVRAFNGGNVWAEAEIKLIANEITPDFAFAPEGWPSHFRFTNRSKHFGKNSLKCFWDFGDGTTSNESYPLHHFPKYKKYTVWLRVTDTLSGGCSETIMYDVVPKVHPVSDFMVNKDVQCITNNKFEFTNLCSLGDSIEYQWITDDGRSFDSFNLTYSYKEAGVYKVRCIARPNVPSESSTYTMDVTVDPPIAQPQIFGSMEVDQYDTIFYRLENGSQFDSINWEISGGYIYDGQFWKDAKIIWDDTAKGVINMFVRSHTGCILQFKKEVKIKKRPWTGAIRDLADMQGRLNIYPNPGSGLFMISTASLPAGPLTVNIYNTVGQRVFTRETTSAGGAWTHQLDLTTFTPGIYTLHLSGTGGGRVARLMVRE